MSDNHKGEFIENIKRLKIRINDRKSTRSSRMIARLDYSDKVSSNYL